MFVRRHWGVIAIFAIAVALVFAGAVYVLLWFGTSAQSTGLVPSTLGLWTMANLVAFVLYLVFWELLLVGIPVVVGVVVAWQWWKRLPDGEKGSYRFFGGRSKKTRGGGGISLLFFIAFAIKVFIDGRWNTPIATWTLDYVLGSMVTILEWGLVILGIPAALAAGWWISRRR